MVLLHPITEEPENVIIDDNDSGNYPEISNMITGDKIVDLFVDVDFREMNPNVVEAPEECHKCECKDKVINNQENLIRDKEALVLEETAKVKELISIVKEKENKLWEAVTKSNKLEKESKEAKDQHEINVDSLTEAVGSLIKSNNNLKVELAKEKLLRESIEKDKQPDNNSVSDAQVHVPESSQRVSMNKESKENKCQACDKSFNSASDLDMHMNDKHTESTCPICDKNSRPRSTLKSIYAQKGI